MREFHSDGDASEPREFKGTEVFSKQGFDNAVKVALPEEVDQELAVLMHGSIYAVLDREIASSEFLDQARRALRIGDGE